MTSSPVRIVVPIDVIGDEVLALAVADRAAAQRAEIHVGLPDMDLLLLAVRSVHPRRPLWRRIVARIGGAR